MSEWINRVHFGDCLETLRRMPDGIAQTCVTSPPYFGLRDYGHDGQIGLEDTPEQFIAKLVEVFREVRRVLRDDGTAWVNMGDGYAGTGKSGGGAQGARWDECGMDTTGPQGGKWRPPPPGLKTGDLIGVPWMLAFALRADGWFLRQEIIWSKPNPMPESMGDRCTKSHEHLFLLAKRRAYYCDMAAIREPAVGGQTGAAASFKREGSKRTQAIPGQIVGTHRADREDIAYNGDDRNRRSVWTVPVRAYAGAHFAVYPAELIEPCILAGAPAGGVVLDPFFGSGTTGQVAQNLGRHWIGCELNPAYKALQDERLRQPGLILEAA